MAQEIEILLADDSPADVELTVRELRRHKLANHIHVAEDGQEALDFIFCRGPFKDRSFAQPPRVILLDLKMPKVDGIEGYKLGVNAYIQKPVDFDEFRKVIEQIGMFWLVVNEAPPPGAFVGSD